MNSQEAQESPLLTKTQQLATRIRALVHGSWWVEVDRDILRQVLRSGTSVGANYREACYAESPSDFIHKLKLVRKEAAETLYWLDLLIQAPRSHQRPDLEVGRKLTLEIIYLTSASIRTIERKLKKRT